VLLLRDRNLELIRSQRHKSDLFRSFDRAGFGVYGLFCRSRMAGVRGRPDRVHGDGHAEKPMSFSATVRQYCLGHGLKAYRCSRHARYSQGRGYFDPQAPRDWRRWIHLIKSHFACRRADHARDRHRCRRARLLPGHGVGSARGLIAKSAVQGLIDGNRACRSGVTMVRS
jgi:hypothetical protein